MDSLWRVLCSVSVCVCSCSGTRAGLTLSETARALYSIAADHNRDLTLIQQITYLTHACMDLKLGDKRMAFDPWLIGPAFARGWWLLHEPPSDWLERLCKADLIYISHMHSDHLR